MARYRKTSLPPPYLKRAWLAEEAWEAADKSHYPFNLLLFRGGHFEIVLDLPVTIIVGENGVGKSTLIEALAAGAGFDAAGGGPGYRPMDHSQAVEDNGDRLAAALRMSWLPKISQGWFFRAESFFSVARYLDQAARESFAAPPDFLSHSHGEGFLRFFGERCDRHGIFFFDEPESALSPRRQFDFLKTLRNIQDAGQAQVVMATHSPILMALPGARLLSMTRGGIEPVRLEDTAHFRLYREFALDPLGTIDAMLDG